MIIATCPIATKAIAGDEPSLFLVEPMEALEVETFPLRFEGKLFDPADLDLSAVDLNTTTDVQGNTIDLSGFGRFNVFVVFTIVGTAPDTGTMDLEMTIYTRDGTMVGEVVLMRLSSTASAGTYTCGVGFGSGNVGVFGTGATIPTADNVEAIQVPGLASFKVNNTTAHNAGTSMAANVYLFACP